MTGRERVFRMLVRAQNDGAYSNLLLGSEISENSADRAFITLLFYGIAERRMTLDHIIRAHSRIEFDSIENETLQLLRMGIYQLMYTDVPESAAVNETVKLATERSKGFVNAVLRSFIRDGKRLVYDGSDDLGALSVKYSCARWIVKQWANEYGAERTEKILASSFGRPPVYARVNTTLCDADDLIYEFAEDGVKSERYGDNCVMLTGTGSIENLRAYRNGLFHVQDLSSQMCCEALDPKPGETVIDICAATGGKTFTIAELMNGKGVVYSFDIYEKRCELIRHGAKRLGLDNVTVGVSDASVFNDELPKADRILCDVPCSGLGVMRRKPEIKYKRKDELSGLPEVQKKIVNTARNYIKPGGRLVYSTCTLCRAENEDVVEWLTNQAPELRLLEMKTFIPGECDGDGFFYAVFERNNE